MVLKQEYNLIKAVWNKIVTFNQGKIVNIYIFYEISKNINISNYPTLENSLFGGS